MPTNPQSEEEALLPERQGLVETFKQDGIGAGIKQGLGMVLPQSATSGDPTPKSIFEDFKEFSLIGDVGDIASGVTGKSDGYELDWLERSIALMPVLPFTLAGGAVAGGIRTNLKAKAAAQAQARAVGSMSIFDPSENVALSTAPPTGSQYAGARPEIQGPFQTPEQKRAASARLAELQEARDLPQWAGLNEATTLGELSGLAFGESAKDAPNRVSLLKVMSRQIIMEAPDGTYGDWKNDPETAELEAAKSIMMRTLRAQDLGLIQFDQAAQQEFVDVLTQVPPTQQKGGAGKGFGRLTIDHLVQFEAQARAMGLGPGSVSPTPQTRLAGVIVTPEGIRTLGGAVGETLPVGRIMKLNGIVDKAAAKRALSAIDFETLIGDGAVTLTNIALEEQAVNPRRFKESVTWYPRVRKSLKVMQKHTGIALPKLAAQLSALSPRNKWGGNIVAGLHAILRYGNPNLDPKSAEYIAAFQEAMDAGGWWDDALGNQNVTVRNELTQYGSKALIREFFSDVDNLVSQEGSTLGMLGKDKELSPTLLLLADLPWQLVLRMAKTGNFTQNIAGKLKEAVTIDVHSDKAWIGANLGIDALGSKGTYQLKKSDLEAGWTLPSGEKITADTVVEAKAKLEALNIPLETMIQRPRGEPISLETLLTKSFAKVPSATAQARYMAQVKSHQLAAEMVPDAKSGGQMQSATWIPTQERNAIIDDLRKAKTLGEFRNKLYELSVWDRTILDHMEGNPEYTMTVVGITSRASADLNTLPTNPKGFEKSRVKNQSVADTPIRWEMRPDGAVDVYADLDYPGVRDTLRHLTPSGFQVGVFQRMVPRTPRIVRDVDAHAAQLSGQTSPDGLPLSGVQKVFVDPQVDLFAAGNRVLFEFEDRASAEAFEAELEKSPNGFASSRHNLQHTPAVTHHNALTVEDWATVDNVNAPGVLEKADWVAMTGENDQLANADNAKRVSELEKDIVKAGGTVYKTQGTSNENMPDDLFEVPGPDRIHGPLRDIAEQYIQSAGIDAGENYRTRRVEEQRAMNIADAFDALPMFDEAALPAYNQFADEVDAQYDMLVKAGYTIEWSKSDPYPDSAAMRKDVRENKYIRVFITDTSDFDPRSPLIRDTGRKTTLIDTGEEVTLTPNDLFRGVHDIMGHATDGNTFGPLGEENAWRAHARMFSPLARRAMTTETRGQNSWVNFGRQHRKPDGTLIRKGEKGWQEQHERDFSAQKMALLPEEYSQLDTPDTVREVNQSGVTAFGLPYSKAMSLAKKYGQRSVATRAGLMYTDGRFHPATGEIKYGENAKAEQYRSSTDVGGRTMNFSAIYDGEAETFLPENVDELMAQKSDPESRVAVKVELGGLDTGTNWEQMDALWAKGTKASKEASAYVHGDLWKPPGTARINEHVASDRAGRTLSHRSAAGQTSGDTHQVLVPRRNTFEVSPGENPVMSSARTSAQARALLEFDQDMNTATVDGDVQIVFKPGSDVVIAARGSILNVKVDGEQAREGTIFIEESFPQIAVGIADMGPGRIKFRLSRGKVSALEADNPTDLYKAVELLARAGVEPQQVVVEGAKVGAEGTEVDYRPERRTTLEAIDMEEVDTRGGPAHDLNEAWQNEVSIALGVRVKSDWSTVPNDFQLARIKKTMVELTDGSMGVKVPAWIFGEDNAPGGVRSVDVFDRANMMGAVLMNNGISNRVPETRGIVLNDKYLYLAQQGHIDMGNRPAYKGDPIVDTFVHETGHLIHGALFDQHLGSSLIEHTARFINKMNNSLGTRRELGSYADSNPEEFFAEAFAAVAHGEASPAIVEYVNDVMRVLEAPDPFNAAEHWWNPDGPPKTEGIIQMRKWQGKTGGNQ